MSRKISKEEIIEAFKKGELFQKQRPTIIKPREAFYLQNKCWIEFLNDREGLEKLDDTDLNETEGKTFSYEATFQVNNNLLETDGTLKYPSLRAFAIACYDFIRENLKAISRGERNEIETIGKFGLKEVLALNTLLEVIEIDKKGKKIKKPKEFSYFHELAEKMDKFLSYIGEAIEGLEDKAKLGIFKVGVCPYHWKNKPECGLVFVGRAWNSEACETHAKKWVLMRIRRNYKANTELAIK